MKINLQLPENLENDEDPKRDIHGSNAHGMQGKIDLLSELGAWKTSEWVEGEEIVGGSREKYISQQNNKKIINNNYK